MWAELEGCSLCGRERGPGFPVGVVTPGGREKCEGWGRVGEGGRGVDTIKLSLAAFIFS